MLQDYVWRNANTLIAQMDPEIAAYTGAFGGWVAAHALLAATRVADDAQAAPLSLNIDFLRGIGPGEVAAGAALNHATRSLRFVRVVTEQGGENAAVTSVIFARRRPTDAIESVTMPECASPEALTSAATTGLPITWVNKFDLRFVAGALGERVPSMRSLAWVRLKSLPEVSYAMLAAIADTPLPRIFLHYNQLSKISTVTMNVNFCADHHDLAAIGRDFVLTEAWSQVARHGYYDQQMRIWSRGGRLLATSSQIVWFDVRTPAS